MEGMTDIQTVVLCLQFLRKKTRSKKLQKEWAVPLNSSADVNAIFAKYCQGFLSTHPWSELEGLQPETVQINEKLVALNNSGFLTINSQPAVNGEKSDSPNVGMYFISFCLY